MIQDFSPWGHATRALKETKSALRIIKSEYVMRPLHATWNFLRRDAKMENNARWDAKLSRVVIDGEQYSPSKDDPFIFKDNGHYRAILSSIKQKCAEMEKVIAKYGIPNEGVDTSTIKSYLQLNARDRKFISFYRSEYEILNKFTIQRFTKPYWYVAPFSADNQPVTDSQKLVLQHLLMYMKSKLKDETAASMRSKALESADPIDTNAGAPFFDTGASPRIQIAELLAGSMKSTNNKSTDLRLLDEDTKIQLTRGFAEAIMRTADKLQLQPSQVIIMGANRRSGQSRKWSDNFLNQGDDVVAVSETVNIPRTRAVYMSNYPINIAITPLAIVMKTVRSKTPGWWHDEITKALTDAAKSKFMSRFGDNSVTLESDFSGYDRSMSLNHRLHLIKSISGEFKHMIPDVSMVTALNHANFTYAIPDLLDASQVRSGIECIPKVPTGLYSGLKLTSEIGSYLAMWATLHIMVQAKIIKLTDISSGSWMNNVVIMNLGDDVLLTFKSKNDALSYSMVYDEIYKGYGVKAEVAIGNRFLMRHIPVKEDYPVIARILQQTISNEHIRKDYKIFILGFLARTMRYDKMEKAYKSFNELEYMKYVNWFEELLSSTATGSVFNDILKMSDTQRLKGIANISTSMASDANKTELKTLMSIYERERFSTMGKELNLALNTEQLLRVIEATEHKTQEVFNHAVNRMGLFE